MRRAVAVVCCLIVGAQVLVGVPLAVCIVFFWLMGGSGLSSATVEVQAGPPYPPPSLTPVAGPIPFAAPATVPSVLPLPPASTPSPVAAVPGEPLPVEPSPMLSSPASPSPTRPAWASEPPPNQIPPAGAQSPESPSPIDNPILDSRQRAGSPLAGTVLSETIAPRAEEQMFLAALQQVVDEEQAAAPRLPEAAFPPDATNALANPRAEARLAEVPPVGQPPMPVAESKRISAGQYAVRQLYAMADEDEQAGEYERADQWRHIAREILAQQPDGGMAETSELPSLAQEGGESSTADAPAN